SGSARALRATEPLRRSEVCARRAPTPDRPVVSAPHDEEAMPEVEACERGGERRVLLQRAVPGPGVEPERRVHPAQAFRRVRHRQLRAVRPKELLPVPEDGADVVGALVAGPALDDLELAGMVERDVERAVPSFREAADGATPAAANRPVPRVDRAHDVA